MPGAKKLQLLTARLEREGTSSPAPPLRQLDPPSMPPEEALAASIGGPVPVPTVVEIVNAPTEVSGDLQPAPRAFEETHRSLDVPERVPALPANEPARAHDRARPPASARGYGTLTPRTLVVGALVILTLGLVAGATAAAWFGDRSDKDPVAPSQEANPPREEQSPSPRKPFSCKVTRHASRIAASLDPNVPIDAAPLDHSDAVAVGYAASPELAIGLVVDGNDLTSRTMLRDRDSRAITHIGAPTHAGEDFVVDRLEEGGLVDLVTIAEKSSFTIGLDRAGVVVRHAGSERPMLLWESPSKAPARLFVASAPGASHVVALAEERSTKLATGWISPQGSKRSKLVPLSIGAPYRGTPALAVNGEAALVVIATRFEVDAPWGLEAGIASWGAGVESMRALDLPATSQTRQSPRLAALPEGRWLLQWTEGQVGQHSIVVCVLDEHLHIVGSPLVVSPPGLNAGAGAVSFVGRSGVSSFLVKTGTGYELWAAAFSCA